MNSSQEDMLGSKEGILLINKPAGKTSFHLVYRLRQLTGIKKIGHCGTLDPFATGVMVMLVGKTFTRCSNLLTADHKQYLATLHLGKFSTTYDKDGAISNVSDRVPSFAEVEAIVAAFQGEILQTPPMFSAKKIDGKKLYELARQGIEIERPPQKVEVRISIIEYSYPFLTIDVSCSKGTYIRSLAHDMGNALKTGAYLEKLVRLRSGNFALEDCIDYSMLSIPSFNYRHHLLKLPQDTAPITV